jgi:quercetin dioxygenase-like cupin family protein
MTAANARPAQVDVGTVHDVLGMKHIYKTTAAQTNGQCTSFEAEVPPGCGAPMHQHERDAELFHVISGELTFVSGTGQRVCRAGESAYLPPGTPHAFYNAGSEIARAYVVVTPGPQAEGFFAEIDAAQQRGPMDVVIVTEIGGRYGIEILSC